MLKPSRRPIHEYELVPRESLDVDGEEAVVGQDAQCSNTRRSWLNRLSSRFNAVNKLSDRAVYAHYVTPRRRKRSILRILYWTLFSVPYLLIVLVLVAGIFFPSYTVRPPHYDELRKRATDTGRANPYSEKVFIAASLYEGDGQLTSGGWGKSVLQLIDLLGPDNVHLSIYEDNPSEAAMQSLARFRHNVTCKTIFRLRTEFS